MSHLPTLTLEENGKQEQPTGYPCFDGKMFAVDPSGNLNQFCDQPLIPIARNRSVDGVSHNGVILGFSSNGKEQEIIIDMKKIYGDFNSVLAELADKGINILTKRTNDFKRYLQQVTLMPYLPVRYVITTTGFVEDYLVYSIGKLVLMAESVKKSNKDFTYRPKKGKPADGLIVQGDLEGYVENVLKQCLTEPQKFAICVGLAAPLAELMSLEGSGFHVFGPSGSGKSTILQAMASVMGSGSEPGDGSTESFIISWSSTSNGMEALTTERSGLGVCIDELGAFRSSNLSSALYKILSGAGKARMTSNYQVAEQQKASVLMLSTGELSIEDKLRQSKSPINAGLLARLPSMLIEPSHMALESESHSETAQRIERFKDSCNAYGGHLGASFVQHLLDAYESKAELEHEIREQWEAIVEQLSDYAVNSIQRRVIRRFALVLVAGLLAHSFGLLPWSEEEISDAIVFMIDRWQANIEMGKSDLERVIDGLKDWCRQNFHKLPDSYSTKIKGSVDGYRYNDQCILLLPEIFRGLCNDVTPSQVGNKLKELGVLTHDSDKQQYRVTIPSIGKRQYFYCIDYEFIGDTLPTDPLDEDIEAESDSNIVDKILQEPQDDDDQSFYEQGQYAHIPSDEELIIDKMLADEE
ncbi:DUF927 domain-containing protein [Pseudoalteromonas sp. SCSIO 43088]|uniref:DUF927 domain-containing protein n=1 Tax=Pseudoalteromonas sp. SCSIO 43088 TaxID=2822846 RepID=UPI00202B8741|nr:DUF927 domain-containing protein [Pseudoalteromonas sp. SCSIO 43088]URQ87046.1 DUF927 domain-containing protein [Pseudoalteromonas sp. SCSIO 43088]